MLFHYTSIDTLGLILKHRQIKFNRLDRVNDPLDGFSTTFLESQKLAYVSCFTKREDDSIPMWSMYTDKFKGIRIGFPLSIFGEVENERFGLNIREIKENFLNINSPFLAGPVDVEYKKTVEEVDHQILKEFDAPQYKKNLQVKGVRFDPFIIGKYKLDDWNFEKECRFIIFNINYKFGTGKDSDYFSQHMEEINLKLTESPDEIYVPFSESIFSNVEILLGPCTTESDRIIVEALVAKYAPEIQKIEKSNKRIK